MSGLKGAGTRAALIVATTVFAVVVTAGAASAADDSASMSGFDLKDSHDLSIWAFTLSLNEGGVTDPGHRIWAWCMQFAWSSYVSLVGFMIWILDWVLSMEWMPILLTPLEGFAVLMRSLMDSLGLAPVLLTVLACVVGYWFLKGRYAGGFIELAIGLVIAALAVGALSDPMAAIAGDDGMIYQGRDAGVELATAVATGEVGQPGDDAVIRDNITASMVDALIRVPHQIINYGSMIDGMPCETTYDDNVGKDNAREAIGGCDAAYHAHADDPNARKFNAINELVPTGLALFFFSAALVIVLILAVLLAGFVGIQLIWQLVFGVVSGEARGALFRSFANAAFAMAMVALASVFVVAWMQLLVVFFSTSVDLPWMIRIRLFNLLLIGGIIALFVMRQRVKKVMHKMAERLASLGPNPSAVPPASTLPSTTAKYAGKLLQYQALKSLGNHGSGPSALERRPPQASGAPNGPVDVGSVDANIVRPRTSTPALDGGGSPRLLGAGSGMGAGGGPPSAPGGPNPPSSTAADRLRSRLKTVGNLAGQAAAAYVSGGTSTLFTSAKAASAAAKIAKAAQAVKAARGMRDAKTPEPARSARNHAVREEMKSAQSSVPRMKDHGRRVVDEESGANFTKQTVKGNNGSPIEILRPVRSTPAHSTPPANPATSPRTDSHAAHRLTERLSNGAQMPRGRR